MNIKITISKPTDYYKNGKLKKNAHTEGFMLADTDKAIDSTHVSDFLASTAKRIKEELMNFRSPYFFSHIIAQSKATGEEVWIHETVGQFPATPKELFNLLTK